MEKQFYGETFSKLIAKIEKNHGIEIAFRYLNRCRDTKIRSVHSAS